MAAGFYRRQVSECLDFLELMFPLVEGKELDFIREPQSSKELSYGALEEYAGRMAQAVLAVRTSRDALLTLTLPVEGIEQCVSLPSEVLIAQLDVWEARILALRRSFSGNARLHRRLRNLRKFIDPKTADIFVASKNTGGFFGGSIADRISGSHNSSSMDDQSVVERWLKLAGEQIDEEDKISHQARDMTEVEDSLAKVSNALSVLEAAVANGDEAADAPVQYPILWSEAQAELGRLQMELSTRQATLVRSAGKNLDEDAPVAAANRVWDGSQMPDPTEVQGLRVAERYSNKLNGLDPSQVYQVPQEDELEESQETSEEEDASWLDFRSFARHTLCEAAKQALRTRCMVAAKRAFEVLACQAYGLSVPMASFEFLCWLQSTEVCMREEMVFKEKLPQDHDERVQLYLLRNLESRWPFPEELGTYKAIRQRLEAESPFFQRLQLDQLPSIEEIVLSHLPALTLVVTLQFRSNYIYAGAVLSPDAGDRTERAKQLQPMVARHMVHPAEVQTSINRISSTNSQIEKQLLSSPEVDPQLRENIRIIVDELDQHLMEPLSRRLEGHFWQCGLHAELPGAPNPRQLLLLPDASLANLPLETMPSLLRLFGDRGAECILRDHSLHMMAKRVRDSADVAADSAPLKVALQTLPRTSLLDKA